MGDSDLTRVLILIIFAFIGFLHIPSLKVKAENNILVKFFYD